MFKTIILLSSFSTLVSASSNITCFDSTKQLGYSEDSIAYGNPPRKDQPRQISTETWTLNRIELGKVVSYDNGQKEYTGTKVQGDFDQSSLEIIPSQSSAAPGGANLKRYKIKLNFFAPVEPPFSYDDYVVCDAKFGPAVP